MVCILGTAHTNVHPLVLFVVVWRLHPRGACTLYWPRLLTSTCICQLTFGQNRRSPTCVSNWFSSLKQVRTVVGERPNRLHTFLTPTFGCMARYARTRPQSARLPWYGIAYPECPVCGGVHTYARMCEVCKSRHRPRDGQDLWSTGVCKSNWYTLDFQKC
jgi:hypothetical protein